MRASCADVRVSASVSASVYVHVDDKLSVHMREHMPIKARVEQLVGEHTIGNDSIMRL